MSEGQKSSGAVTVLSIVGLVFGLIGMMGSFIPCLGSLAFFVGLPAALISGLALFIARANNSSRTFALVALVISLIGVVVSGTQYFSIVSAGKRAQQAMEPTPQMKFEERAMPMQAQQPAPAPVKPPVDTSGINIVQQEAAAPANSDEARKLFVNRVMAMIKSAPSDKRHAVVLQLIVENQKEWTKIPVILLKGLTNTIKLESSKPSGVLFYTAKTFELMSPYSKDIEKYEVSGDIDKPSDAGGRTTFRTSESSINFVLTFKPFYKDVSFEIYVPKAYKGDYKITLDNARVGN